jgi:hypothetical protein
MTEHHLPELEIDVGRATRWSRVAVRVGLALVTLLAAGAAIAVIYVGPADSLRAVRTLLGGGG